MKTSPVSSQQGFVLFAVLTALVLVAAIALMLSTQSAVEADRSGRGTEALEAEYLTQAALEHAIWQNDIYACAGDFNVPTTVLGAHSYAASVTGGGATTTYSLSADQDAWIRDDQPTNNNGGDSTLHINDSQVEQPLYRFDLSSLPAGAQINSASASFYVSTEHPQGPVTVHRITAGWDEGTVTWDSISGSVDGQILAMIPAQPDKDVRAQANLTAQVQAWVNGEPNNGILLASSAPGIHAQYVSREGASNQAPRLDVVVGTAPASPVSITATGTLANGVTRTLSRPLSSAYQPPGVLELQPDGVGGTDAYIWASNPTTNYGTDDETWVSLGGSNTSRSLFTFALGAVPAGSKILSAVLSLHHESGNNFDVPVNAHRITNPWNEVFVTWNRRDNGTNWDTAGGDFDAAIISTTSVDRNQYIRYEWDIASLVQDWTDGAYPNYGVALATARINSFGERFYTSDETDPTLRPRLTVTYACECGSSCMAPQGGGAILMLVGDDDAPAAGDLEKQALFESWGYTVDFANDNASEGGISSAMASYDVLYVAASVSPTTVGTKLTNLSAGIVTEVGELNDELGIASGSASPVDSSVNIGDNTHYITVPFASGTLDIYSAAMEGSAVAGVPAPGLQTLGDWNGAGGLVVLDQGAALGGGASGDNAAGRRVLLPIGGANIDFTHVNSNGRLIVQRALAWSSAVTAPGVGKNVLLIVADLISPAQAAADRKTLMETWGHTVTLIDDDDTAVNFAAAIDAADVIYVGSGTAATSNVIKMLGDTTKGVVNEPASLATTMGFASSFVAAFAVDQLTIVDSTHSITQGFSSPLTVFTALAVPTVLTGTLSPDLQNLGEFLGAPGLAVLESGARRHDAGTTPGRRAQLPFETAVGSDLTADGQLIVQRAIEWVATTAPPVPAPTYNVLLIVGNAMTLSTKDAGYKALMESWGHTVAVLDDGESQSAYDTAMAAADVVYATGSASGPSMLDKATNTTKGLVNEVNGKIDNFGFASSTSNTANFDSFSTTDAAHYITESFGGNAVTVFAASLTNPIPGGTLAPDLQNVAADGGTLVLGTLEAGATGWNGNPVPARRAHLPFTSAEATDMTSDGKTILQRTLEWAAGADSGSAGGLSATFLDEFNANAYNGNDGTLSWSNDWQETGESDGPGSGDFRVLDNSWCASTSCLQIREDRASTRRLSREADLTGAASATLSLNYRRRFVGTPTGGTVTLEISGDGVIFAPLKVYQMDTQDSAQQADSFDISSYIASNTQIRFSTSNALYETALYVDNVLIDTTGSGGGGDGGGGGIVFEEFTEGRQQIGVSSGFSIPKPSGTSAGDLLIVAAATDGNTVSTLTPSASWNLTQLDVFDNAGEVTFGVWWKIADGTESSSLLMQWTGGEQGYGWIMRFTGHDSSSPIATASMNSGNNRNPPSNNLITGSDGNLILRLGGFDDDDITLDAPGLSGHTVITMDRSNTGNQNTVSGGAGYVIQTTAGDTGGSEFNLTAREQYRTVTLAIRPAQ